MQPTVRPQEPVDPAHQLGLVLGEVIVDRDHVHAATRQRVEVRGRGRHERLALAGLHLGDVSQVKGGTTGDLHVEVPLPQRAPGRLAHRRERLRKQLVQGLPLGQPSPIPVGLLAQLHVGEPGEVVLQRVDLGSEALQPSQDAALAGPQHLVDDLRHAAISRTRTGNLAAIHAAPA